MSKYILVDLGSVIHTAIFSNYAMLKLQKEGTIPENSFIPPTSYSFFNSLISLLKRVGVDKEDTVILAGDGRNSWRKAFDKQYKAQRKVFRESHDIDWILEYSKINRTIEQINEATDFHVVWLNKSFNYLDLVNTPEGERFLTLKDIVDFEIEFSTEADDIIATACEIFKNKECIIITKDADMEMLCVRPKTKFFSMNMKWRGGTGIYKPVDNGYKILEKKIRLGDKSDNIIIPENDTERDKEIRKLIIDLINLPDWVKRPIREELENLPKKECNFTLLPFPNSLAKRFPAIYKKDKIITYEDSIKRIERKKKLSKNKKEKTKRKLTMRKRRK